MESCPRCANIDPAYFYLGAKGWYCRRCVTFGRLITTEESQVVKTEIKLSDSQYHLPFQLTEKQKVIARQLKDCYEENSVLLHAACGAGKTELVLDFISDALTKGYCVGWAIPRRSVVLQLQERLSTYFSKLQVIAVCHGFTSVIWGDLIICTTHQLYRYFKFFDYLIIDEPDAYPFKDNDLLRNIALSSVKKHLVFLTATPDEFILANSAITLELFSRPHGLPLPIPRELRLPKVLQFLFLAYQLRKRQGKLLVFVPGIDLALWLYQLFKNKNKGGVITSQSSDKEEIISNFINQEPDWLISTTILERGVTIPKIDVIVYQADSGIFDLAALVQMAGRVGRSASYPFGKVWFLTKQKNGKIAQCIKLIQKMNKSA